MHAPVLEFEREISHIPECPPGNCAEEKVAVFRFVRTDLHDPWNFTPQALKDPSRRFRDDHETCSSYALSVFRSRPEARNFYDKMRKKRLKVGLILGTHMAELGIEPADGRLSPSRSDGHRDLHTYRDATYLRRATIVEDLLETELPKMEF